MQMDTQQVLVQGKSIEMRAARAVRSNILLEDWGNYFGFIDAVQERK